MSIRALAIVVVSSVLVVAALVLFSLTRRETVRLHPPSGTVRPVSDGSDPLRDYLERHKTPAPTAPPELEDYDCGGQECYNEGEHQE